MVVVVVVASHQTAKQRIAAVVELYHSPLPSKTDRIREFLVAITHAGILAIAVDGLLCCTGDESGE